MAGYGKFLSALLVVSGAFFFLAVEFKFPDSVWCCESRVDSAAKAREQQCLVASRLAGE